MNVRLNEWFVAAQAGKSINCIKPRHVFTYNKMRATNHNKRLFNRQAHRPQKYSVKPSALTFHAAGNPGASVFGPFSLSITMPSVEAPHPQKDTQTQGILTLKWWQLVYHPPAIRPTAIKIPPFPGRYAEIAPWGDGWL